MGGNVFTVPPHNLHTPRISSDVYHAVLARVHEQLRALYARVETPVEAPGKQTHGDVDVLVLPKPDTLLPSIQQVARALGAERHKYESGNATVNYAVPWPAEFEAEKEEVGVEAATNSLNGLSLKTADTADKTVHTDTDRPKSARDSDRDTPIARRHIQVDVHVTPDPIQFAFTLFLHSHGDLWTILGTILRPYGLTCTPKAGLSILIPELERRNKSIARVTLTHDPDQVLRYLGLAPRDFYSSFATPDDLLAWICTTRFFDAGMRSSRRRPHHSPAPVSVPSPDTPDSGADTARTIQLNASDRRKSTLRPLFRYWLDSYLPSLPPAPPPSPTSAMTRDQIVADAKSFFGPAVAAEYDTRRAAGVRALGIDDLWSSVRREVPCSGGDLTVLMKGLKFEVGADGGGMGLEVLEATGAREAFESGRFDEVKAWAMGEWESVLARQTRRDREQSTRKLLVHLENEKVRKVERGREE